MPQESDNDGSEAGLVADPKRQATALFKGLDFQIWLTVDAWITLEEEQVLVVEGVEDFDIIKDISGVTTQAKALSQPITLRSASVVDAIRNFWTAKHQNPGKAIDFRFVTTAGLATEAGDPFGPGVTGLALWMADSERGQTVNTETLKQFLITDPSTSAALAREFPSGVPSLLEFLKNGAPDQVYAALIRPIKWLTQHAGVESAKDAAQIRLHAYGERMGLLPKDADRALPHLFEAVAQTACKGHRTLTRETFRLLFEEVTNPTRREQAQLQAVVTFAQQSLGAIPSEHEKVVLSPDTAVFQVPNLPPIWVARDDLVHRITSSLESFGFVGVHGSTGKGKSTLAKLAVAKIPGGWEWVNFRGMQPGAIHAALSRVAQKVANSKGTKIVLDNIDVRGPEEPRLARKLAALTRLSVCSGGLLVVTAQREFPFAFRAETELPDSSFIDVPPFTREEIELLCRQGGCPEKDLPVQAVLLILQTGGHPALANASVSMRKRRGWSMPTAEELLQQPKELLDERQMARQLLSDLHESEVELLHRLSLLSGFFRRDQAVALAELDPGIGRPADKFDQLVGPWIESTGGDYFRLSSLLSGSGVDNWSKERVAALRQGIGLVILKTGKLTLVEAGEVLLQSCLSQHSALASLMLLKLLALPFKSRVTIARELWWVVTYTNDAPVFPDYPMANFLFRHLQFRVASAANHESAPRLAELVMAEAQMLTSGEMKDLFLMGVTAETLITIDVLLAPKLLLASWLRHTALLAASPGMESVFPQTTQHIPEGFKLPEQTRSEMLFSFILYRQGDVDYLIKFVEAIDDLVQSDRKSVCEALRSLPMELLHFTDRAWTAELGKPRPDWDKVIAALKVAWKAGQRWNVPELVMAGARGVAAIQDEYLDDAKAALETLSKGAEAAGRDGIILRAQRGTVFSRQGRYRDAYEQWVATLDEWNIEDTVSAQSALLTYSKCGAAATLLDLWEEAAQVFLRGRRIAQGVYLRMDATAFGADAAHALWRAGKKQEALGLFAKVLQELEEQAGASEPPGFQTLSGRSRNT